MKDEFSSQDADNPLSSSLPSQRRWMAPALVLLGMVGVSAIVWGAKNFRSDADERAMAPVSETELHTVDGTEHDSTSAKSNATDANESVGTPNVEAPTESIEPEPSESEPKVFSMEEIENPTEDDFFGVWICTKDGIKRRVENRDDGTATMDVVFNWVASFLYGQTMTMDCEWSYNGEVLEHTVKSGRPQENVDKLTRDFGKTTRYEIIRISEAEMLLLDLNDPEKLEYLWKAVVEE